MGKDAAKTLPESTRYSLHDLADKPDIGRACNDIREGYYKYGVGKHLIFYRHKGEDQVEIVRILHGRMDLEQHL